MAEQDDAIDCIPVVVTLQSNGTYSGTYTTPDSGSFASTVSCNVKVNPPVPNGNYTTSCSSTFFTFSNIQPNQATCTTSRESPKDIVPVPWTTFSFQPSPTSWTSGQTITVTMTGVMRTE